MNLLKKHIESSENKEYYRNRIKELDKNQKDKLENLLQKMNNSGAKRALGWALSEVTENIPQFGRFLFLKGLYNIINDVQDNMAFADDIDEDYEDDIFEVSEKLKKSIGEAALNNFLKSYTKGVMWQITNLIDEGNYNRNGEPGWCLKESKKDNTTNRFINGLHESFNEFEDELK